MSVPDDHINSPVLVPRSHCQQITGVVGAASWRRAIRKGIFHDDPFPIQAVGAENVSLQKPVSFAVRPMAGSHRLSNLLGAIHPLAHFLSSILVNNSDPIFTAMVVCHVFSPQLEWFWRFRIFESGSTIFPGRCRRSNQARPRLAYPSNALPRSLRIRSILSRYGRNRSSSGGRLGVPTEVTGKRRQLARCGALSLSCLICRRGSWRAR